MQIREVEKEDLQGLLALYTLFQDTPPAEMSDSLEALWERILQDKDHHILVGIEDGKIVTSCVVVIIPNLNHDQRPYALVENVVTDHACRNRGYATACLDAAKKIAQRESCYKIMLMTGSKKESTLSFYEKAGYNRSDKTAFIQWI